MEPKNHQIIESFISDEEAKLIKSWVDKLEYNLTEPNHHLNELAKSLNGRLFIFDISQTEITKYITQFQSVTEVSTEKLPTFVQEIINRISKKFELPTNNIFLQVVDMNKGGSIEPHYDATVDGFINFKCNISVLSDEYKIYIGDYSESIKEKDLYSFEASLYKHWTKEFHNRRILLSFGFMVEYSVLNRSIEDPRIRLSKRIQKYFQSLN